MQPVPTPPPSLIAPRPAPAATPAATPKPALPAVKSAALLFGLNYRRAPDATLNGCINDVRDVEKFLRAKVGITDIKVCDDEAAYGETTLEGIVRNLTALAERSRTEGLALAWIHYSGHGSCVRDVSSDERDGRDECLVPADFATAGLLLDDRLCQILSSFSPKTRLVVVVDACHSGTMGDLSYRWADRASKTVENRGPPCASPVVMISGCRDTQTSADAAFADAGGKARAQGAMTTCMLRAFEADFQGCCRDVFTLVERTRALLAEGRFSQVPELTSSYDLAANPTLVGVVARVAGRG